ncbi:MAG TPA: hypothetical protein VF212_02110 [Longimicrobiales bacterium]
MGLYDDISPEDLRADLRRFAELILSLDGEDRLLEATPRLLKVLGDLRAKIFAYEVRVTGRLFPREDDAAPGEIQDARRIVEEAIERFDEAEDEWSRPWEPGDPPD